MTLRTPSRRTASLTALGAVLVAGVGVSAPAGASITGAGAAGIEAGQNITVFHNIDFVAVFGYGPVGTEITVDVIRDGVTIGTSTGPTVDTPEGPGLEVNHGLDAGVAGPGDCWVGTTPDIRPGDRIVVTEPGDTDEVTVDDIRFTGQPVRDAATGTVTVPGTARYANGTPVPVDKLDSGEFRDTDGTLRAAPNAIVKTDDAGGFAMQYKAPYVLERNRQNLSNEQIAQSLLQDGHAVGFGHVVPLPLESMLVDGTNDTPGPALGCEASPAAGGAAGGTAPQPADTTAPTVTGRAPAAGATAVARTVNTTATFSEDVAVGAGSFTLTGPAGAVPAAVTYDATTRTATLDPAADLVAGTRYTAALTGVTDRAGNALPATSWSFTTVAPPADTTAPTVTGRAPAAGATNVARTANATATFSEAVTGTSPTTVTLRRGKSAVAAAVSYDATTRTVTLDPSTTLQARSTYTVGLTNGIRDAAGNALAGTTWTFTTGR